MTSKSIPVDAACSTRPYYFQTDTFQRPIKINLFTNYHSQAKAASALQAALYPVKVVRIVEMEEGMEFMNLPGEFDETGKQIKKGD